jgi:hypothetical protein
MSQQPQTTHQALATISSPTSSGCCIEQCRLLWGYPTALAPKKNEKMSHQKQMDRSNKRKQKEVQGLAHIHATIFVTIKRAKPKENCHTWN